MIGKNLGVSKRISNVASEKFLSSHCILHREALASKKMSPELNDTLQLTVKIINNIKSSALNSRIFALLCSESDSEYQNLLYHAEIRWLSRGKTLSRVYALRDELSTHFKRCIAEKKAKQPKSKQTKSKQLGKEPEKFPEEIFVEKIDDPNWLSTLSYLADIFRQLNQLNLGMQGRKKNCFHSWNKVEAFKRNLGLWTNQIKNMDFSVFPLTYELLPVNEAVQKFIQPIVLNHIQQLIREFDNYFPASSDPRIHYSWVVHPFLNVNEANTLTPIELSQLTVNVPFIHST